MVRSFHIINEAIIKSLQIGTPLYLSDYVSNDVNEGELLTFDWILSEDKKLYLLEINTDLALTDLMLYGSAGIDFERIKKHLWVKGYEKVKLVIREEDKGFNPEPQFISKLTKELPQCQVIYAKSRENFSKDDDTYYIKNLPTTKHGEGLITLSRYKNLFRDFLKTTPYYDYMPNCQYDDSDYCEEYIKPYTDEYGNPIVLKCLFLMDKLGMIPIRPQSSNISYSEIINLVGNPTHVNKNPKLDNMFEMKFENSTFVRSGIWAQVGGETKVEVLESSTFVIDKPIREVEIGDKVKVSTIKELVGHHYPTPAKPFILNKVNDDTIVDINRPWVDYKEKQHNDICDYGKVSNIHQYTFKTWVEINNFMFSPIEFIYINRDNEFQFVKTTDVKVGDRFLDNPITHVELHEEPMSFYGLQIEGYDNYYLENTIITTTHHLPKP